MLPLSPLPPLPSIAFSGSSLPSSPPPSPSPHRLPLRPVAAAATCTDQPRSSSSYLTTRSSFASLYEILGIPAAASHEEIKAAYRRLARACHPDVDRKDSSADEFMKIHAAYSTLSDPQKRATYDRTLFVRRQRPLSTVSSFSGYGGRNWETDQCW